jgi:hypothetical protein
MMKSIFHWISVFVLLVCTHTAIACSCRQPRSIKEAFDTSAAVVVAEAIEVKDQMDTKSKLETQTVTWLVWESFKGKHPENTRITTVTTTTCCVCGLAVQKNEVMLLYVNGSQPYSLSICGKTTALKAAVADIPALYRLKSGQTK